MEVRVSLPAIALCFALASPGATRVDRLQQAAGLIEKKDPAGAEALLTPLLAADPADAVALNLLGLVRVQQQRTGDAEELFRKAAAAGHNIVGPHLNLAMLYGAQHPSEAMNELKLVFQRAPDNTQAKALLRNIARSAALAASRSGQAEEALELLRRARGLQPNDAELLSAYGLVALDRGRLPEAGQAFEEAARLRPGDPDLYYARARLYLEENRAALAEKEIRLYLAERPADASAQYGLGYILRAEQKPDEAKAAFEESVRLRPDQTESVFQLGEIAMEQERKEDASAAFAAVLARDPHHAGAIAGLGILAYRAGSYADARERLELAIAAAPAYQKAHYYYALTLSRLGQKEAAEREFSRANLLQKPHLTALP